MGGFLGGIYLTIAFGLLVFQFALFYKLWIMTGNIKELLVTNAELSAHVKILTKYFCEKEYIKFNHGVLALKGVTYTQDGSNVKFSDGLEGKIHTNVDGTAYFYTENKDQLLYENIDFARNALYDHLTENGENPKGFITKRTRGITSL